MRPLKLYIEGLQSFRQLQEIDFERLSAGGLFGIFGKTGSGKSSILDAMVTALYGDTGKKREKRDLINLSCDRAYVKFVFETNEKGGKAVYTVERSFRVRKGGSMDNTANVYKKTIEGDLVVADSISGADKVIQDIIGLNADEFKKCVVLPQGEFASFIKADRSERLKIIGSLFNLEQYGEKLFEKVAHRKNITGIELGKTDTAINTLGDFDYADIDRLDEKIETGKKNSLSAEKEIALKKGNLKNYECIINDVREINRLTALHESILQKKPLAETYRQKAESCKKANSVIPFAEECGRLSADIKEYKKKLSEGAEKLNIYGISLEKLQTEKNNAEKEFSEKGQDIKSKIALLDSLKSESERLIKKTREREMLLRQYAALKEKLSAETQNKERFNCQISKIKAEIENAEKAADIGLLVKKGFTEGSLSEINSAIDFLRRDYGGSLPHFTDLKGQRENELDKLKGCGCGNFEESLKQLKELKNNREKLEEGFKQSVFNENRLQNEICKTTEGGSGIKADIDGIIQKFKSLGFDCLTVEEIDKQTIRFNSDYSLLKSRQDKAVFNYEKCRADLTAAQSEVNTYNALLKNAETELAGKNLRLTESLKIAGFGSGKEAFDAKLSDGALAEYEKFVKEYDEDLIITEKNILQLKTRLNGAAADEGKFDRLSAELKTTENRLSDIKASLAVDCEKLKGLKEKREKLIALKTRHNELLNLMDKIQLLYSLVKGKNFMEYVAEEYILDITQSASVQILRLTGGRFALAYKEGCFYVADNYSGGELRSVNTLSGGETFLVSLSLAVALSEAIVKMSDKPVEFFFLDEGFGTLDRELCDTVMNTLEKLKRSHFTIGLISHVPELMQRLPYKLTVNPPDENRGSAVQHFM